MISWAAGRLPLGLVSSSECASVEVKGEMGGLISLTSLTIRLRDYGIKGPAGYRLLVFGSFMLNGQMITATWGRLRTWVGRGPPWMRGLPELNSKDSDQLLISPVR